MKVKVTGMGIISSIGMTIEENYHSLQTLNSGISNIELVKGLNNDFIGGEIKIPNKKLAEILEIKNYDLIPRSVLLSLIAAKEAWGENKPNPNIRTAIVGATTVGGMDLTEQYFKKNKTIHCLKNHPCGTITNYLENYFKLNAFKTTISTACSSAANAIMFGSRMIKHNFADRVLVGGSDALTHFTIEGFNSLKIYDPTPCKPFDKDRNGLNLGEAGAYIVLENEKSISITKNKKIASILGWGNANDSYHQTASSPEGFGAQKAMQSALKTAHLSSSDIDYINAHGTATLNNDLSEGKAIEKIFGIDQLFSSTKGFTGHTLAAAGIVECIYSILSMKNNIIFPVLNHNHYMQELKIKPERSLNKTNKIDTVLSNSFGFGGNNTSIIISK